MRHLTNTKLLHSIFAGSLACMGPLGRKLSGAFASGNHTVIATCEQPDQYSETFVHDYAAYSFLRKYEALETGIDTRSACLTSWIETEVDCMHLNAFWSGENHGPLIHSASRKISEVLGVFDADEFFRSVDHSGGASTQRRRTVAAIQNKESDNHYVTLQALGLLKAVQRHMGYYATPMVCNFSRFDVVPKDSKTDRPIIIENQGNMHLQKAIGSMIRRRLRNVGVDLNDQSINQQRAGRSDIATIDLSSASDLIWSGLIPLLLPQEWSDVIIRTRGAFVNIDGELTELQKIGGMGNGYVFELESLLFWAISSAAIELQAELGPCKPNLVTVYGDDIIVDSTHAQPVMNALQAFGFRINKSKSFWHGPFRESCGYHYYNGKLITPIYIKRFDFTAGAWYHLYNSLRTLGERLGINFSKQLNRIEHLLKSIGEWNLIPKTYGLRAGIHKEWDEALPRASRRPRNSRKPWVQGWQVRVFKSSPEAYHVCQQGAYLLQLRKLSQRRESTVPLLIKKFGNFRHLIMLHEVAELSGDYNNNTGDRKFNLRTGSREGPEGFVVDEISWW